MSTELHVYTPATTLLMAADLAADSEAVNWELALLRDLTTFELAPAVESCVVVGWESDADTRPACLAALAARDRDQLDALYRDNAVAIVELDAEHPYTPDPEELAEWERLGVARRYLQRVRTARIRYSVRTNASRNDLSAELQTQLWLLVGVLTDGLCEDPEQGQFIDPAEDTNDELA